MPSNTFGLLLPCPAEQFLARVRARRGDPQVLKGRLGLATEVVRHRHLEGRAQVAERPVLLADAAARNPDHCPVRRARLDAHGDRGSAVRRHLDVRTEREFGDRHWYRHRQVVPAPAEYFVRLDVHADVQVARLAATLAWGAATENPDRITVRDPGVDARLDIA